MTMGKFRLLGLPILPSIANNGSNGRSRMLRCRPLRRLLSPATTLSPSFKAGMPTSDLLAGSLSGFVSCVLLQPLEVIKTRLQQQQRPPLSGNSPIIPEATKTYEHVASLLTDRSFRDVMKPLLAHPTQLWRGTVPTILRNVPGVSLYFYSLSFIRTSLIPQATRATRSSKYVTAVNVSAGMLARAGVGFILMPVSVIKVRFESNLYNYTSLAQASKDIFNNEGVRGFFSGFGTTALRDAPYAGIQVALYEGTKALIGGSIFLNCHNC